MKTYLFITDTDFKDSKLTGAHKRYLELLRGVSKNNKIILVSSENPQIKDLANIIFYEIKKSKLKLPSHVCGMIELCSVLRKIKSKIQYDYAISFSASNTICYWACGFNNITTLLREDIIEYQKVLKASSVRLKYFVFQEHLAVIASKKIIVQCKNDKNNLIVRNEKYCKNIKDKVFLQINNVNASWIKSEYREQYNTDNRIKILFVGEFSDDRKGHSILIPAVAKLMEEMENFILYVAGDGVQLEKYKNNFAEYHGIVFLGRVNNLQEYYSMCDFEVVPSLIDSCPNTVLEGLNAGIAVYGSNRGGIPDLLLEEKYLFEPNVDSLYLFLKEIIKNKRYRNDAIDQIKRKKELSFNWCDKIQNIIEN